MSSSEGPALPRGLQTSVEGAPLPRGPTQRGEEASSSISRRQRESEQDDVLFGKSAKKMKKRPGHMPGSDGKKARIDQIKSERDQTDRKTSTLLSYSKLSIGMRLLACVKSVTEEKVVLSLVNNLTATIAWSEVSDEHFNAFEKGEQAPSPLSQVLPVGSFVRCIVTSTTSDDNERHLRVSCRASLLNKAGIADPVFAALGACVAGSIRSIEDHGVIVNLGLKNLTGFIPFAVVAGGKQTLHSEGQQVEGIVTARPTKLVVNLKLSDAKAVSVEESCSFSTLQPGVLVDAKYRRNDLFDGGALFSLWGPGFDVAVDWLHCGDDLGTLEAKDKRLARVLWVDPSSKTLGVSLLDRLVRHEEISWERNVGDIISDAIITRSQPRIGLRLALPEPGFAHIGKLVEAKEHPSASELRKDFAVGKKVSCRILDLNPLDGTYGVSLQPSVLAASVTSYETLKPGMKISGKVIKVDPSFGVLLELGHHVRGIVTLMHLSDSAGSESAPESRFKVGQMCKGRVLTCSNDRVSVTLKKSLVSFPIASIATYEEAKVGTISLGFVTKVDDFGIIVTFFAGVHGIVPAHTLGAQASKLSELYRVGQVVKVKVVSVDPEQSRMRLTLNTTQQIEVFPENVSADVHVGDIIPQVVVTSKNEAGINVEFKSEKSTTLVKGFIPKGQLTDFVFSSEAMLESLTVGSKLKKALVLRTASSQKQSSVYLLSLKPELILANTDNTTPENLDQVEIEGTYSGYVSNVTDFGVFVWIGKKSGLTAFVPLANVWDAFVAKPQDYFQLNQTVRVSITAVDQAQSRIVGSLKPSVVGTSNGAFLQQFLEEKRRMKTQTTLGAKLAQLNKNKAVLGRVDQRVEGVGVSVKLVRSTEEDPSGAQDDELTGFCTLEHCPNQKLPRIGTELAFRILDLDFSSKGGVVDLSARKSLEHAKWRGNDSFTSPEFDVEVELGKKEYSIVSYKGKSGEDAREIALCSLVNFNNYMHPPSALKPGVKCRVKVSVKSVTMLELVSSNISGDGASAGTKTRPRARSGSLSEFLGPRVDVELGAVLNAKIRDIRGCWMQLEVRQNSNKRYKYVIHSTDVIDNPPKAKFSLMRDIPPGVFGGQSVGDVIQARVVEIQGPKVYFSMRPSMIESRGPLPEPVSWKKSPPELGKIYQGYIDQVGSDGVFVGLSRHVRGFCFCTDVTQNLGALDELFNGGKAEQVFPIGRPVKVQVTDVDVSAQRLTVKLIWDDETSQ